MNTTPTSHTKKSQKLSFSGLITFSPNQTTTALIFTELAIIRIHTSLRACNDKTPHLAVVPSPLILATLTYKRGTRAPPTGLIMLITTKTWRTPLSLYQSPRDLPIPQTTHPRTQRASTSVRIVQRSSRGHPLTGIGTVMSDAIAQVRYVRSCWRFIVNVESDSAGRIRSSDTESFPVRQRKVDVSRSVVMGTYCWLQFAHCLKAQKV
jgi:hypothetical protein